MTLLRSASDMFNKYLYSDYIARPNAYLKTYNFL